MTHDDLCTTVLNSEMSEAFCNCDLIRRVREDERGKARPTDMTSLVRTISTEMRAAIDLYVLEEGPLRIEQTDDKQRLVVKQDVRLRLKEADELRAAAQWDEREACIAAVGAHIRADLTEQAMFCGRKSDLLAAIRARGEKP